MHKKTTKIQRLTEKQANGRLRSALMTIRQEGSNDDSKIGYPSGSFGKSRSDSWDRQTDGELGSWSEDIEAASSRRILEQWNVVERTLFEEEEQLVSGPLFDECVQWRNQLPHLRIVAHALFDQEDPERKSTAASSKPSSTLRRREKSAQRNDKNDDFFTFQTNFFSTDASLVSSHQPNYRQAKDQVLDHIVEFICKELAEIEAEKAAEDLSDEFNELLKITPAPTTTGKNPLISNNFYYNVEGLEACVKNNGDRETEKGKEREVGKESKIARNKLGMIFNERIIVSPVPFIATSRESFTTLRMTPIQYLGDNQNGVNNARSYHVKRECIKRKLPLSRKTPLIAAPHVQSTWNTPVCPTVWPKNFKLTPIDISRLPSSKRRPTKTAESIPARRSRNSLSPISRSVQPSSPRSCTRGEGLYDALEIRGSHIVADGKPAKLRHPRIK